MPVSIRESNASDNDHIQAVHRDAFGEPEGEVIARLALELLQQTGGRPTLSLVAEQDANIVGNVIFTPVTIDGNEVVSGYILAPLAVAPGAQGGGVGTSLIRRGLQILGQRDADFVLVLGDPAYYSRSGFQAEHRIKPPYELAYPEAWMAQALKDGVLAQVEGSVRCVAPLMAAEHW